MTRIAFVSDLHVDYSLGNRQFVPALKEAVALLSPDVFIIGGDIAAKSEDFRWALAQFTDLPCLKLVVPGNHDIWIESKHAVISGHDSGAKYFQHLPRIAVEAGFTFLHDQPVTIGRIAIAGCMGWYDYSYRNPALDTPDILAQYARGRWQNPRTGQNHLWNDMRFVWWLKETHEPAKSLDRGGLCRTDVEITGIMTDALTRQLERLQSQPVDRVVVVTHFIPLRKLLTYYGTARDYWHTYQGADSIEAAIRSCAKIGHVLFGHRHEDTDSNIDGIRYLSRPVGYLDNGRSIDNPTDRICLVEI